jgi:hypothetical protein
MLVGRFPPCAFHAKQQQQLIGRVRHRVDRFGQHRA